METLILYLLWDIQINSHIALPQRMMYKKLPAKNSPQSWWNSHNRCLCISQWMRGCALRSQRGISPNSAISFWDQFSEFCQLESWSVLSSEMLYTGPRGRKTLWSKWNLVEPAAWRLKCPLGHFYLPISGLGTVNISLRFLLVLRGRFHVHNERILWRNPGYFHRSSLQTRKQWNHQVPLHQAQSTQTAHDTAKGVLFLLCMFCLWMVIIPNLNFGRRIMIEPLSAISVSGFINNILLVTFFPPSLNQPGPGRREMDVSNPLAVPLHSLDLGKKVTVMRVSILWLYLEFFQQSKLCICDIWSHDTFVTKNALASYLYVSSAYT